MDLGTNPTFSWLHTSSLASHVSFLFLPSKKKKKKHPALHNNNQFYRQSHYWHVLKKQNNETGVRRQILYLENDADTQILLD